MDNSHCGYIVKLQNVRPYPNADKLQLTTVFGNQVKHKFDNTANLQESEYYHRR